MTTTFKATAITATTAVLTAVALSQDSVDWLDFPFGFAISSLAVTGWLLAVRRPDNSIGWILSLAGLLFAASGAVPVIGGWAGSTELGELSLLSLCSRPWGSCWDRCW